MARPKKIPHKKRADGTYEAKVTIGYNINGKPIRKSFYSAESWEKAKAEGERYKIEQELAVKRGEITTKETITFRQVAEEYKSIVENKIRKSTYEIQYKAVLDKHILPFFGDWQIRNIRRVDIEKYFIAKKDLVVATLKTHRGIMRAIFQHAVENGYLYSNPVDHFRIEVGRREREKNILTATQMELLKSICIDKPTWLKVGILLQEEYGLSRSEVLGIKREDVDVNNKTIHIQRSVSWADNRVVIENTKNKYRNRLIPISDDVLKVITGDPHFCTKDYIVSPYGEPYSPENYTYHFAQFFKKMISEGYDLTLVTPHGLRHSRASLWVAEDKNLFAIAELLGWSDLEMLRKRYGHADVEAIRKQLEI